MNLTEELQKLAELKKNGMISESEYAQAKSKILYSSNDKNEDFIAKVIMGEESENNSIGKAANRYVDMKMISMIIGAIIFLLFGLPMMCSMQRQMDKFPSFPGAQVHFSPTNAP